MFFLSGATGLAYQVIWFKRFSHVWGNSSLAMGSVVASFLLGLGLGAHLFGGFADRSRSPIFWYGVFEAVIGLLVILIPLEITWLFGFASHLYPLLGELPLLHSFVRSGLTFLVIGPPCILMGGTLPLLIRQFTREGSSLSSQVGWLYGINTVGAAAGCFAAGFYLLPLLGLFWSSLLAAGVNLAIGAIALILAARWIAPFGPPIQSVTEASDSGSALEQTKRSDHKIPRPLLYVVALTGFASLALEMVWSRQLALILGGSTYAFSAMLFVVLVGIGLGALLYHRWIKHYANWPFTSTVVIIVLAGATLLGKLLVPQITLIVGAVQPLRSSETFNALTCVAASTVLQLVPAIAMGVLFPLFIALTHKSVHQVGSAVGTIYASNTLGSILGALVTSLLLIPLVGTAGSLALALGFYLVAIIVLFPHRGWRDDVPLLLLCLLGVFVLYRNWGPIDPRVTNFGMYLYGYVPPEPLEKKQVLFFKEGRSCNVMVTDDDGHRSLRINGKVDANNRSDMRMQLGLAYFPRFLHPSAKDILVIGFGSGSTTGTSLLFGDTRVHCCEIEEEIVAASKYFAEVNHQPLQSPNLSMIYDDGRSFLQGSGKQFDLILSAPSNPWIAGLANLFTREFWTSAKAHLKPGGVLAQWIQSYSFSPADYAMVVRTLSSVFPYVGLIRVTDGDTILLASESPLDGTSDTVNEAQALVDSVPAARQDLQRYFATSDVRTLLLWHYLIGNDGLRKLGQTEQAKVNTDLNLRLEFDAPLHLFDPQDQSLSTNQTILASVDVDWIVRAFERWGCGKEQAPVCHALAMRFKSYEQDQASRQFVALGLRYNPDYPELLADRLIFAHPDATIDIEPEITKLVKLSPRDATRVGAAFWKNKKYGPAVNIYKRIIEAKPQSATSWANLAVNYRQLGEADLAEEAFRKALSLDELNVFVEQSFKRFQAAVIQQPRSE